MTPYTVPLPASQNTVYQSTTTSGSDLPIESLALDTAPLPASQDTVCQTVAETKSLLLYASSQSFPANIGCTRWQRRTGQYASCTDIDNFLQEVISLDDVEAEQIELSSLYVPTTDHDKETIGAEDETTGAEIEVVADVHYDYKDDGSVDDCN